jgi:hypothetical protein
MAVQHLKLPIPRTEAPTRKRRLAEVLTYLALGVATLPTGFMLGATIALFGQPVPTALAALAGMAAVFGLVAALLEKADALPEPGGE